MGDDFLVFRAHIFYGFLNDMYSWGSVLSRSKGKLTDIYRAGIPLPSRRYLWFRVIING